MAFLVPDKASSPSSVAALVNGHRFLLSSTLFAAPALAHIDMPSISQDLNITFSSCGDVSLRKSLVEAKKHRKHQELVK